MIRKILACKYAITETVKLYRELEKTLHKLKKTIGAMDKKAKWDYYYDIIQREEEKFLDRYRDIIPEYIYDAKSTGGMQRFDVIDVDYEDNLYYNGSQPTDEDIRKIKRYANNIPDFREKNIIIEWVCMETLQSGFIRFADFKEKYYVVWMNS